MFQGYSSNHCGALTIWLFWIEYAKQMTEQLKKEGFRVHLDDRNEKLPAKIRDAQLQKVPYMLVVGQKEAEAGTVSLRHRTKGDLGPKPVADVIATLHAEVRDRLHA